jgi:putative ABC transport system ATP-binding protein
VAKRCKRADEILEGVGLGDRGKHKPSQLSGGQQQRVAVARGLVTNPDLLIADEPTANLDHIQAEAVVGLFRELRSQGRVIVVSTHDARLVPMADRVVRMTPDGVEPDRGAHEVTFAAGDTIFHQEDPPEYVYRFDQARSRCSANSPTAAANSSHGWVPVSISVGSAPCWDSPVRPRTWC